MRTTQEVTMTSLVIQQLEKISIIENKASDTSKVVLDSQNTYKHKASYN